MASKEQVPLRHFGYIDALRGYAILGVIVVHSAQNAHPMSRTISRFAEAGQYGVQLFFIVSGLTLMLSWDARRDGIAAFYIRRLFRIAPMFWLAIPAYLYLNGTGPQYWAPRGISPASVLLTASFLHGWEPQTINSVVPGGWSIAVEMTFYCFLPVLARFLRSGKNALFAALALAMAYYFLYLWLSLPTAMFPSTPSYLVGWFLYFWFPNQLPIFLFGFVAYFGLKKRVTEEKHLADIGAAVSLAGIAILALADIPGPVHLYFGLYFLLLTYSLGQGGFKVLSNKPMRYIGTISYSAYLVHFAVLDLIVHLWQWPKSGTASFLLFFICVIAATIVVASTTYHLIEKPLTKVGHKVARRIAFKIAEEHAVSTAN